MRARVYTRVFAMYPHYPPPLQGGVARVRAIRQAQILLPSIRREVEANVSVSQTL
jgi:hypothetical protein